MSSSETSPPPFTAGLLPSNLNLGYLPELPLYGAATDAGPGWALAPVPLALNSQHHADLHRLGPVLLRFMRAIDDLYRLSSRQTDPLAPDWVAPLYDQGKSDALLQFARMKRLKSQTPLVLRPDLLLRGDGWTLCEVDSVPGGIGFTSALNRFYRLNGLPVIEPPQGMPRRFLDMLKAAATPRKAEAALEPPADPVIAIVLSDEAADYRAEMQWLVDTLQTGSDGHPPYPNIVLLHPRDVDLVRDRLVFTDAQSGQEKAIDLIYRFFELFDLPNIPKIELIQYAIKKGLVQCTPPIKPHLEEKLSLALLHHPALVPWWEKSLGGDDFTWLKHMVPPGWIVDPTPVPPQAVIAGLAPGGRPLRDFHAIKTLNQKERELVLKPSGFSPLAWGSRGVTIGHDHPAAVWGERVDAAMASFGQTPYILQEYRSASVLPAERINLATGGIEPFQSRVRLCPYYFVVGDEASLAGILATVCPADKKLIHGMRDAVLVTVSPQ
jgi:hypothetical protein